LKRNYKVIIQFDGTHYCGWQYQAPPDDTIQRQMQRVLKIVAKQKVTVTGSSRTDAGVHSRGLTASFVLPVNIEAKSLQRALNSLLPADIRIADCQQVHPSFNARFHAQKKTYKYYLFNGQILSPFLQRFACHVPYPLDYREMRRAVKHFMGTRDFSSFTSDDPHKNRTRNISFFKIKRRRDMITFTIEGKSFLRYMVRNIVGTLIDVGRGKISRQSLPAIFARRDRRAAGQTAPAKGLVLEKVEY